jgi:hypothetical protein
MSLPPVSHLFALPKSTSWTRRRSDMNLTLLSQWPHSSGLDAKAYPSPPMTDSPTSPNRTQQPEERSLSTVHEVQSSVLGSVSSEPRRMSMTPQVLPPPVGMQQFSFEGQHQPTSFYDPRHELQPRPRAQSIPHYQAAYHGPVPGGAQHPLSQASGIQFTTPAYGSPLSISGSAASRFPKSSRRAKAHVARACQNCKKAHLSCDDARPCARCVASGKQVMELLILKALATRLT